MPIAIGQLTKSKALVVELIRTYWMFGGLAANNFTIEAFLLTQSQGAVKPEFSDPAVVSAYAERNRLTTSGQVVKFEPFTQDLDDGSGNGILIAVPRLFLGLDNDDANEVEDCHLKILYRVREVDIAEFVGIAQSQIGG